MKRLKAKIGSKVVGEWDIPEGPEEITFDQQQMFLFEYQVFLQRGDVTGKEMLMSYARVISHFFKIDIEEVMNMPVMYYDQFEKEMTGLFLYLFGLINTYVPRIRTPAGKDHVFTWDGDEWVIPWAANVADPMKLTYGQAIELLEIERLAMADRKSRKDHDNINYSSGLYKFCTLVKKVGEELPTAEMELKELVRKRAERFLKIDMCTVQDALFFLRHGSDRSIATKILNGSRSLLPQVGREMRQESSSASE